MFSERLSKLLTMLGASPNDIACSGGPDRTGVSHYLSGRRVPKENGTAIAKLTGGIYAYALEKGKTAILESITADNMQKEAEFAEGGGTIRAGIERWLFEKDSKAAPIGASGISEDKPDVIIDHEKAAYDFGNRFDAAMKCANLSNMSLSRLINVDASLISRYRNGLRLPRANSEIVSTLGSVLWQYITKNDGMNELALRIGADPSELTEAVFESWLFSPVNRYKSGIQATEQLLQAFDMYGALRPGSPEYGEHSQTESEIDETKTVYYGNRGLQEAVVRFLVSAMRKKASEIWLYSDQGMSWMMEEGFAGKWASLMEKVLRSGIRIRIIHNINRNYNEMAGAIRLWLPLYITGMIEPYYYTKSENTVFSHTLFICPKRFAVLANNVAGMEADGVYHYHTDKECLAAYERQFSGFLKICKHLISFPDTDDATGPVVRNTDAVEGESIKDAGIYPRELSGSTFCNIRIVIYRDFIEISPVLENWKPFRFSNPVMYRAFLAYEEHIKTGTAGSDSE